MKRGRLAGGPDGLLPALVAVTLWGGSYAGLQALQAEVPPAPLAALRCAIAVVPLAVAVALSPGPPARFTAREWIRVALLGLFGNTLFQLGLVGSLRYTSAAHASIIVTLSPLLATLLAWAWLGERLRRWQAVGVMIGLAGVLVIVTRGGPPGAGTVIGDLLAFGAAAAWAVYSVFGRPVLARHGALPVTLWAMVAGALALLPVGLPGLREVAWSALGLTDWALLAYLSVLTLAVANLCWYRALSRLSTARVVVCSHLTPLVAMAIAVAAGQERLTGPLLLGAAAILAGVYLTQRG